MSAISIILHSNLVSGKVTSVVENPYLQMMVTSQQEVQTITQTSTGYKFGHNVNPYEELTMEPITAMFLVSGARRNIANLTQCTVTKICFVFGSITSLLPRPGGYHHYIGVRPAGLGGELLSMPLHRDIN